MSPELRISLKVTGVAIDPSSIEAAVGLTGTGLWRKGDPIQSTKICRKDDGWEFRLPFRGGYFLDELVRELRNVVGDRGRDLRRVCDERGHRIGVDCVVRMFDDTAGLLLAPDLVAWLAEMGAAFEIDTYVSAK